MQLVEARHLGCYRSRSPSPLGSDPTLSSWQLPPKHTQGKRTNNIPKRQQDPEGTQRGNDLALSANVRSMGQRNTSGGMLSTSLSHGQASMAL